MKRSVPSIMGSIPTRSKYESTIRPVGPPPWLNKTLTGSVRTRVMPIITAQIVGEFLVYWLIDHCRIQPNGECKDYFESSMPWHLTGQLWRTLHGDRPNGYEEYLKHNFGSPNYGMMMNHIDYSIWTWFVDLNPQGCFMWIKEDDQPEDDEELEFLTLNNKMLNGNYGAWKPFPDRLQLLGNYLALVDNPVIFRWLMNCQSTDKKNEPHILRMPVHMRRDIHNGINWEANTGLEEWGPKINSNELLIWSGEEADTDELDTDEEDEEDIDFEIMKAKGWQ
nr:hypothetical protein [Crucivirus sp.]